MKKLFVLAVALMISTASVAGIMDVYNTIDSNNTTTKVDKKAGALKNKVDSKLGKITTKATSIETKTTTKQEQLKSKLEAKLADLVKNGEGESTKANDIRAEIESLQKLISAAQQ